MRNRRLVLAPVLLLLPVFVCGCFTVRAYSPSDMRLTLLASDDPVEVTTEYKAWYLFWGMWKVSAKEPADVVREERLRQVRFETKDKLEDSAMGALMALLGGLPIFPLPQTISIEGNR